MSGLFAEYIFADPKPLKRKPRDDHTDLEPDPLDDVEKLKRQRQDNNEFQLNPNEDNNTKNNGDTTLEPASFNQRSIIEGVGEPSYSKPSQEDASARHSDNDSTHGSSATTDETAPKYNNKNWTTEQVAEKLNFKQIPLEGNGAHVNANIADNGSNNNWTTEQLAEKLNFEQIPLEGNGAHVNANIADNGSNNNCRPEQAAEKLDSKQIPLEGNSAHVNAADNGSNNAFERPDSNVTVSNKAQIPHHTAFAAAAVRGAEAEEKQEEKNDNNIHFYAEGATGADAGDTRVSVSGPQRNVSDMNKSLTNDATVPPASENEDSEINIDKESLLEGAFGGDGPDEKATKDTAAWYSRLGSNEQDNIDRGVDSIIRASRRIAVRWVIEFVKERLRKKKYKS